MKKAVFIDKDGTLIRDISHNVKTELIEFSPGAFEALHLLQQNGFLLIIVTNQPGIALGYFTEDDLMKVQMHITNALFARGIHLNGFYYCPHHPSGKTPGYGIECSCRKPAPGLLLKAASDMGVDLSLSWMVGDILNDVEAGNQAGCRTVLIDNGNETEWVLTGNRQPTYMTADLPTAAQIIINEKIVYGPNVLAQL